MNSRSQHIAQKSLSENTSSVVSHLSGQGMQLGLQALDSAKTIDASIVLADLTERVQKQKTFIAELDPEITTRGLFKADKKIVLHNLKTNPKCIIPTGIPEGSSLLIDPQAVTEGTSSHAKLVIFRNLSLQTPSPLSVRVMDSYEDLFELYKNRSTPLLRASLPPRLMFELGNEFFETMNNESKHLKYLKQTFFEQARLNSSLIKNLNRGSAALIGLSVAGAAWNISQSENKVEATAHEGTLLLTSLGGGMIGGSLGLGASALCGPAAPICAVAVVGGSSILGGAIGHQAGELYWQATKSLGKVVRAYTSLDNHLTLSPGFNAAPHSTQTFKKTTSEPQQFIAQPINTALSCVEPSFFGQGVITTAWMPLQPSESSHYLTVNSNLGSSLKHIPTRDVQSISTSSSTPRLDSSSELSQHTNSLSLSTDQASTTALHLFAPTQTVNDHFTLATRNDTNLQLSSSSARVESQTHQFNSLKATHTNFSREYQSLDQTITNIDSIYKSSETFAATFAIEDFQYERIYQSECKREGVDIGRGICAGVVTGMILEDNPDRETFYTKETCEKAKTYQEKSEQPYFFGRNQTARLKNIITKNGYDVEAESFNDSNNRETLKNLDSCQSQVEQDRVRRSIYIGKTSEDVKRSHATFFSAQVTPEGELLCTGMDPNQALMRGYGAEGCEAVKTILSDYIEAHTGKNDYTTLLIAKNGRSSQTVDVVGVGATVTPPIQSSSSHSEVDRVSVVFPTPQPGNYLYTPTFANTTSLSPYNGARLHATYAVDKPETLNQVCESHLMQTLGIGSNTSDRATQHASSLSVSGSSLGSRLRNTSESRALVARNETNSQSLSTASMMQQFSSLKTCPNFFDVHPSIEQENNQSIHDLKQALSKAEMPTPRAPTSTFLMEKGYQNFSLTSDNQRNNYLARSRFFSFTMSETPPPPVTRGYSSYRGLFSGSSERSTTSERWSYRRDSIDLAQADNVGHAFC